MSNGSGSILWLDGSTDEAITTFATTQSEERFRAVFEAASVGIALASTDDLVFMANRALCEMLAVSEAALKGRELGTLVVEDVEREGLRQSLTRLVQTRGRHHAVEQRLRRSDGEVLQVRRTSSVIADAAGVPHTLVVVIEDLTERKKLEADRLRKEYLQSELAVARRIQTSMLPRTLEAEALELAARTVPAEEVGGDYYDVLPTTDGAWIAIGDVAGHGLPAGILMLTVQSAVAALVEDQSGASPREVLARLNRVIYHNIHHRLGIHEYVTLSLIRFFRDGRLVVAGAHEDIIVYRARHRRCEVFSTQGTWIGVINDIDAFTEDAGHQLEDGDVMVLFTDGVTEATSAAGEPFGFDRLRDALAEVGDRPTEAIVEHLVCRVRTWAPNPADDITVLAIRYRASTIEQNSATARLPG